MKDFKKHFTSPYFEETINGIQRAITLTNTDKLSSTFGCSHRDYWLYKTSDFADSVRNFSSNSFALASIHPYYSENQKEYFSNLSKASILYWMSIQHNDGSFDEFYPYERGWVGPTAFTLYSNIDAFKIVKLKFSYSERDDFIKSVYKAYEYISLGDQEGDHLANHHAMAYLALMKAYEITDDNKIRNYALKAISKYFEYNISNEGWSIEYDGIDPGYLTASCSFLSKTLSIENNNAIRDAINHYSRTIRAFCYPDGCFSGPIGSRNTMHLYPYAFELLSEDSDDIKRIAKFSQYSLSTSNAITPNLMSDRYLHYRVEEYLATDRLFIEGKARIYDKPIFSDQYDLSLPKAGIYHFQSPRKFITINLAKQMVLDSYKFDESISSWIRGSFTGLRILDSRGLYTSQYIPKDTNYKVINNEYIVEGFLAKIPTEVSFNIFKNLIFRFILLLCSKSTSASNLLKRLIRKKLMYSKKDNTYYIECNFNKDDMKLKIKIKATNESNPLDIQFGTNISDRYVPQSRFSRISDIGLPSSLLGKDRKSDILNKLKRNKVVECTIDVC
tara:strand:- start:938 stop:2614 length:1677 start_codon:yes stop_codon:yes gene_type:complete